MKIIVTDGMGNDEEKEIDTEKITGKELLADLESQRSKPWSWKTMK